MMKRMLNVMSAAFQKAVSLGVRVTVRVDLRPIQRLSNHSVSGDPPPAEAGLALVMPDTSPRGVTIEGADDSYDFGSGAGFYVDATEAKWKEHYQMYSYVTTELPEVLAATFPGKFSGKASITGHSMGCAATPAPAHPLSAAEPLCHPVPAEAPRRSFPTGPLVAAVGTAR